MIPKENGTMRTILTRIDPKDKNNNQKNSRSKLSEIQQIKKLQAILELCKVQEPSLSGSQVASFDAVLDNLLDFKNRTFNHNHQVNPKIYFCKMDVENCFDSIPHEKLCRVINEILKSVLEQHENENSDSNQSSNLEGYFEIRRFCLASSISSRLCKRYKYVAFMLNKNSTSQGVTMKDANGGSVVFEEQAIHKALINAKLMIIKDVGSSEYFDRRKLMAILNEHLRNSFIHFRKDFHETPTSRESDQIKHTDIMPNFEVKGDQPTGKKKKSKKDSPVLYRKCLGIPQGSIISSILCNFFFGHMEKHKLLRFMKNSQSQLIRWTDDILFMTTSKTIMNDFMDTLCSGFPEYGLRINTEKILVNFITDSNTKCLLDKGVGFPWCGIIINQSNLEVGWDYTRFFGIPIKDCISMDRRSTLDEMAKMFLKPRLLRILFDHRLAEDWKIATKNMYEVIILLAIKMHVLVREMECTYRHQLVKDERLIKMVHNVASYMTAAVRKKTLDPVFHGTEIIFSIVWGAFFRVWRLRPYRYRKIIGSPDMVKLEKQCDWWIQRSKVNLHRTVHEMLTRLIY